MNLPLCAKCLADPSRQCSDRACWHGPPIDGASAPLLDPIDFAIVAENAIDAEWGARNKRRREAKKGT